MVKGLSGTGLELIRDREIPYRLGCACVRSMGGNQSQERIVNVEETAREDGTPHITVSN